jgi:hypothetical protein
MVRLSKKERLEPTMVTGGGARGNGEPNYCRSGIQTAECPIGNNHDPFETNAVEALKETGRRLARFPFMNYASVDREYPV